MSEPAGVAVVTGAAGGIGGAVARRLGADGYRVACVDISPAVGAVADELETARAFRCDVRSTEDVGRLQSEVTEWAGGGIRLLVNAAGVFFRHRVTELSDEDWDLLIGVNLTGPFRTCRAFLPGMIAAGTGAIINVASTAGLRGGRDRAGYSASKGGLVLFTRSLALEHGKDGVRVNCLCPGLIDTEMADWIRDDPENLKRFEAGLPAGRMGTPEEMAATISFLASPAASYFHGAVLVADGGGSA
jgi:NAD(P)-dependent dehydrogenase (short-subunit alcohol dehydrogenase family)